MKRKSFSMAGASARSSVMSSLNRGLYGSFNRFDTTPMLQREDVELPVVPSSHQPEFVLLDTTQPHFTSGNRMILWAK
jgi:hypothetical protein